MGEKHGQGQEIFPNKDTFIGNYRNGLPEGFGKYTWADKTKYEGNFTKGIK
jgi:1-phosphatidylinositol-4-phosphate 5-kinase